MQELIRHHYRIACRFYTPSVEAYIGMALFYQENEDMRTVPNAYHDSTAALLAEAVTRFAQQ